MNSLDYPGVGPEHSFLKDVGRAEYYSCTDEEALEGIDIMLQFFVLESFRSFMLFHMWIWWFEFSMWELVCCHFTTGLLLNPFTYKFGSLSMNLKQDPC